MTIVSGRYRQPLTGKGGGELLCQSLVETVSLRLLFQLEIDKEVRRLFSLLNFGDRLSILTIVWRRYRHYLIRKEDIVFLFPSLVETVSL